MGNSDGQAMLRTTFVRMADDYIIPLNEKSKVVFWLAVIVVEVVVL